jgi:hypothetical protein
VAKARVEEHFSSDGEKYNCIEDYVYRETTVATQRVEDAVTAIKHEQDHM